MGRAVFRDIRSHRLREGASTITQQLARNLFLTPDKNLKRKIQEILLAVWLEHKFSKKQILGLYLNRVYFGAGAYGIEAASQRYFDKSAKDLTVSEAALLAGMMKGPSRYSPMSDKERSARRATSTTAAPFSANTSAKRFPRPLDAPVTSATLPFMLLAVGIR